MNVLPKRIHAASLALLMALACPGNSALAVLPAFPGAEGAGAYATGGRGGSVYHVTTLANSGTGSLRNGIENANGPTTIVFDIAGTITLQSQLVVRKPNITIAGQTAPGPGVTITGNVFSIGMSTSGGTVADNTIVRYLRFRNGQPASSQQDTFGISAGNNVIVDHVSASWGGDENLSVTKTANNVTVQWSLISEGLNANNHGYGSLIAPEFQGARYTFHHNLYANVAGRMPRAGTRLFATDFVFDYRNNVAYNWGTRGDWGGWGVVGEEPTEESLDLNFINNYYIAGPDTNRPTYELTALSSNHIASRIYQSGNKIDSDRDGTLDGADTGWNMIRGPHTPMLGPFAVNPLNAVTTETADEVCLSVMNGVGATFPARDAVDLRVIDGVANQTGRLINDESDVGGLPTLPVVSRPAGFDTDGDGMPNAWEIENGLNPNLASDRNGIGAGSYTNLEVYLNSLVAFAPGDFNRDGVVDAADYVAWKKTEIGNPVGDEIWERNFGVGAPSGSGGLASVPEPAPLVLLVTIAACCDVIRRHRSW